MTNVLTTQQDINFTRIRMTDKSEENKAYLT